MRLRNNDGTRRATIGWKSATLFRRTVNNGGWEYKRVSHDVTQVWSAIVAAAWIIRG
jgi:hypothetical protein